MDLPPKRHLHLVPLAKCEPANYPPPRIDGVTLRRVKREWMLDHVQRGRIVTLLMTTDELRDLRDQASRLLAMDKEDT